MTATSETKLGIRVPPVGPIAEVIACIEAAEDAGFASVWLPEAPLVWHDPLTALTQAASRTRGIVLGTAVVNPVIRHPGVLASSLRTLGELAPGRVVAGVASGGGSVRDLGLAPARHAELRAAVARLRELLALQAEEAGVPAVPVVVAAGGPRNTALAGELADGLLVPAGRTLEQVDRSLEIYRQARASAPADHGTQVVAMAALDPADDAQVAWLDTLTAHGADQVVVRPADAGVLPFALIEAAAASGLVSGSAG